MDGSNMFYGEAVDAGCFSRLLRGLRGWRMGGGGVGSSRASGVRSGHRILGVSEQRVGCVVGRAGILVGRGSRLSMDGEH